MPSDVQKPENTIRQRLDIFDKMKEYEANLSTAEEVVRENTRQMREANLRLDKLESENRDLKREVEEQKARVAKLEEGLGKEQRKLRYKRAGKDDVEY